MKLSTFARSVPALPLLLLAFLSLLLPLATLIFVSLQDRNGFGFGNFAQVFANSTDLAVIANSLQFAMWQTALCTLIGTPIAFGLLNLKGRARGLIMSFANVASNFGGPGLAFAFTLLIGTNGVITLLWSQIFGDVTFPSLGSMVGLNILMLYVHIPMYLMLALPNYAVLRDEWREAAKMAGSGAWRYWQKVGIPVLAPFVLGNSLQMFMWSMGAYGVPYVVTQSPSAIDLLSVEIGMGLQGGVSGLERPATLAVLLIVQAIALVWVYRVLQKRGEMIL